MYKKLLFSLVLLISFFTIYSQENIKMIYEPSNDFPFGRYNPDAPKQLKDFQDLIGICDCDSESRKPDGSWGEVVKMTWKWKYIMNGMGVQDETLKEDGIHSGSIRQYNKDSLRWNVHYYTSAKTSPVLSVWNGNKNSDGNIVLYRKQNAPNGTEGFYRLTFYDITKKSYKWIGEWVDKKEEIIYPTWRISCVKRE